MDLQQRGQAGGSPDAPALANLDREAWGLIPVAQLDTHRGHLHARLDDTTSTLRIRVERLYTGVAWAELPPSRTRHLISNVRIKRRGEAEVEVQSNFLVYRTRLEHDRDILVGTRTDVLRRGPAGLRIARRTIVLDQAILDAKNISVFL